MLVLNGLKDIRARAGSHLGTSGWMEVTQQRIDLFAAATDDRNWIHCDPERARSGPFGKTVAHGFLTLSLIVPLMQDVFRIEGVAVGINYGLDKVRFPAPLLVGSRIRMDITLTKVDGVGEGVQLTTTNIIESDTSKKPVLIAEMLVRFYEAPAARLT